MARVPSTRARASADDSVLFDLLPAPAYIFDDADLQFRAVNAAALARYGYSRGQFLTLSLLDLRPPGDRASARDVLAHHLDDDRYRAVVRHITVAGEVFHVEVVSQPILYQGRPSHFVVISELTERQRIQEALFESRARLQALFDNALDGIVFVNDAGQFVGANPASCALLGYDEAAMLKKFVWSVAAPGQEKRIDDLWTRLRSEGRLSGDYSLQVADGSRRDIEFAAVAGVLPGVHLAIIRDVTARNVAERETKHGLQDLNKRLRDVSARAHATREEDRTRMSRELHDQLGQALAALKIDLCWLEGRVAPVEATTDLPAKVRSMTALVDDTIFRVRRLSSELRPPVLDRLGLVAAIEWQLEDFQRHYGIQTRLHSRLEQVALDVGRSTALFRIFQEALANIAVHAGATAVTVRLALVSRTLVLMVTDNGGGIPAETVESGQSLGLVGMRERAELLGGGFVVRRGRDSGTVVTVTVPLEERRRSARESW